MLARRQRAWERSFSMPPSVTLAAGTNGSVPMEQCQSCAYGKLEPALFLGYLPPVNQMRAIGKTPCEQPSYPAQLLYCPNCELLQLGLSVDPAILFPPDYPYTSGSTRILRENFAALYAEVREFLALKAEDLVVDIGSNDGTLLSNFHDGGHKVLGIEPTDVGQIARERGIETITSYFRPEVATRLRDEHGPARLVTAANVFAHMEDIHAVLEGIISLLDEDGVFVSESHYAIGLLDTLQYDTIYHEHLRYYSLTSLKNLLEGHGLEVVHARHIPTHGGSIRVYAAKKGQWDIQSSVQEMLNDEPTGDDMRQRLNLFRKEVVLSKLRLHALLRDIKEEGGRVCGISAPSRASTLVHYAGLDDGILDYVLEIQGSLKIGKYLPGTLIPVIDESRLYDDQPEYALILSWHIADELAPKLREKGYKGKFITPLPQPRIL